jgi:hypothetical protein
MWAASLWLGDDVHMLKQFQRVREAKQQSGIQARMPFDLVIH